MVHNYWWDLRSNGKHEIYAWGWISFTQYMRRKYMTRLAPEERRAMCEMGNVSKELEDAIKAKQDWASSWWTQFLILFKRTFNERRVDYFSSLKILQVRSKKIITKFLPTTMNLICSEISICVSSQNLPQVSNLMGAWNKWNLLFIWNFILLLLLLLQAIGVAVLLGLLWWRSKTQTNADIQDQASAEKKRKKKLLINLDNQVSRESINIKSSHICMYWDLNLLQSAFWLQCSM